MNISSSSTPGPVAPLPSKIDITSIPEKTRMGRVEVEGRVYKVTITVKADATDDEVTAAWEATTAKVKDLIRAFKLGVRDEATQTTTKSLRIVGGLTDGQVEQEYVKDSDPTVHIAKHTQAQVTEIIKKTAALVTKTAAPLLNTSAESKRLAPSTGPMPNSAKEPEHKHHPNRPLKNVAAATSPVAQQAMQAANSSLLPTIEEEEDIPPPPNKPLLEENAAPPPPNDERVEEPPPPPPKEDKPSLPSSTHLSSPALSSSVATGSTARPTIAQPPKGTSATETKRAPLVDVDETTALLGTPGLAGKDAAAVPKGEKEKRQQFEHNGKVVATDEATRNDTVPLLLKSLQSQEKHIKNQINIEFGKFERNAPEWADHNKNVVMPLREKLKMVEKQIENCQQQLAKGATWASTNSPRFAFRVGGNPKEDALPVLINSHMQVLRAEDGTPLSEVSTSGAISDFTNGDISLKELQDYSDIARIVEWGPDVLQEGRVRYLSALYGIQIHKISEWAALANRIEKGAIKSYGDKIKTDGKFDVGKLKGIIDEREHRLEHMFLQDLYQHLAHRKAGGAKGPQVLYGRIGLLDMQKGPKTEGAVLYERTQGLDTKAILDKFDGAIIEFDLEKGAGPYVDTNGFIHMPAEFREESDEITELRTLYFNISAQGHTKNVGPQKRINQDALAKLKLLDQKGAREIREALNGLDTGAEIPSEAAQLALNVIQRNHGRAAVNCYGGKDRTGAVINRNTAEQLQYLISSANTTPNRVNVGMIPDQEVVMKGWARQMLSENATRAQIAKDNADHYVLKIQGGITGRPLEIYRLANQRFLRARHAAQAVKLGIKAKIFRFQTSQTPGQLYGPEAKAETKVKSK